MGNYTVPERRPGPVTAAEILELEDLITSLEHYERPIIITHMRNILAVAERAVSTLTGLSVQPDWMRALPLQQQSVVMLAGRGPDGVAKKHPCKGVVRAYRGTIFLAGKYGRLLEFGEKADSFMSLERFADRALWDEDIEAFFNSADELPHHYVMHLTHGAQIVGYTHPDPRFQVRWRDFYETSVSALHLNYESKEQMDLRLCDWNREHWQSGAKTECSNYTDFTSSASTFEQG